MDGSPPWRTSFFSPRSIGRILLVLLTNFQAALERILVKKLTQAQNPFIWSQIGCLPVRSKPKQQCNLPSLLYISGSQRVELAAPLLQTRGHAAHWAVFPRPRKLSWPGKCRDFQETNKNHCPDPLCDIDRRAYLFGIQSLELRVYLTGSGAVC